MPKITVNHNTPLETKAAAQKVKEFFEHDQDLKKMDPGLKVNFADGALSGKVQGNQFKADINVKQANQGSEIVIEVDLPLLLSPFKGKIQEMIAKKLAKTFA